MSVQDEINRRAALTLGETMLALIAAEVKAEAAMAELAKMREKEVSNAE